MRSLGHDRQATAPAARLSWPGQARERGSHLDDRRLLARPSRRQRGDDLGFVPAFLRPIHRCMKIAARCSHDHRQRYDAHCLFAALRASGRLCRGSEAPYHLEHTVLLTPVLVDSHGTPPKLNSTAARSVAESPDRATNIASRHVSSQRLPLMWCVVDPEGTKFVRACPTCTIKRRIVAGSTQ